jgi:phage terminase large subunit
MDVDADFPAKLRPLFERAPYKALRGGRGGGKSWGVARALLIIGLQRPIRVLCTRETQKSIRDSVHKLLVDQIARMGLAAHYSVQQVQITGNREWIIDGIPYRTEFVFAGLSDLTADSIKSFEGADIVWVEEGQVVTDRSWTILIPTIRKEGSEIWITFNPELDTDPTWERFIEHPPKGTINIELNWRDNPWFTQSMNEKRLHDKAVLAPYEYDWIWEGKCKPAVTGAIYADQMAQLFAEGRVGDYPVNAFSPVYAVFDLGWNDATAIVVCQREVSALRVIDYVEDHHKTLDHYSGLLRAKDYVVTELYLPHDGAHSHLTGPSAQRTLEDLKWRVNILPNQDVEDGIRTLRMSFKSLYIDKRCTRLIECLKRYRRVIPPSTMEPAKPKHDEYSHGADAMRYAALAAPQFTSGGFEGGMKLPKLDYRWKP